MQDRKQAQIELSKEMADLLAKYRYTGAIVITTERVPVGELQGVVLQVNTFIGCQPEGDIIMELLQIIDPIIVSKQGKSDPTTFQHISKVLDELK